jgi:hypothetical protein
VDDVLVLERDGWRALATRGGAAKKFYASVLRHDAVMLFPGGMRIAGRARILESLGSTPWESFRIENEQVIPLGADAATLVYKVTANRSGAPPYAALVSSTYVRDGAGAWELVLHQQTPE